MNILNLLAAHCIHDKQVTERFMPDDILAIFGAHNIGNSYEAGRNMQSPKNIFIHEDWSNSTGNYDADLSLLEFEPRAFTSTGLFSRFASGYLRMSHLCWRAPSPVGAKARTQQGTMKKSQRWSKLRFKPTNNVFWRWKGFLTCRASELSAPVSETAPEFAWVTVAGGLFIKVEDVYYLRGIVSSSLLNGTACDVS